MEIMNNNALRFTRSGFPTLCSLRFTRRVVSVLLLALLAQTSFALTARQVLEKTAAVVSAKSGVQALFTIQGQQMNTSGTLAVKGRKLHATTPQATIWFDGKTQWTYVKKNDEVNVANPTEAELARINPYNFINLYKEGYAYTMTKKGANYEVHLTATDRKRGIQEMYVVVNQKTFVPSQIRMKRQNGWTSISITNFKQANLSDATFRFNPKDYPDAEVIDLR